MDIKNTNEIFAMLGLTVSTEMVAQAKTLQWLGLGLKAEDNPLRMALRFKEEKKRAPTELTKKVDDLQKAQWKEEDIVKERYLHT